MSGAAWEEVKGLAQDFQRIQQSAASQRLSERNVVEMVNKCLELNLVDLFFTSDGKEYVTQQHLNKEVLDDVHFHGGRRSMGELASALNVSVAHIETAAAQLVRASKSLHSIMGYLVTPLCLDNLARDLNRRLQQDGLLSLADLSKAIDLPPDFLLEQIQKRIGSLIEGQRDTEDTTLLYTDHFVQNSRAQIRGMLSALTQPCPLSALMKRLPRVPQQLFFQLVGELVNKGRVAGTVSSLGKAGHFVPSAFTEAQKNYVGSFMKANGHVDKEVLDRVGIHDHLPFCQKIFPDEKLIPLGSHILGDQLWQRMLDTVEEELESCSWFDIAGVLPFHVDESDVRTLLPLLTLPEYQLFDTVVMTKELVNKLKDLFSTTVKDRAEQDVKVGRYGDIVRAIRAEERKNKEQELNAVEADSRGHKKDDRRKKAAGGKGGGGTQGRETKTKSTKKKYRAGKGNRDDSDSDEAVVVKGGKGAQQQQNPFDSLRFLKTESVLKTLQEQRPAVPYPDFLLPLVAKHLEPQLWEEYLVLAAAAEVEREAAERREGGGEEKGAVKAKVGRMLGTLRLYEKGLSVFSEDSRVQLHKYLLKNYVQDLIDAAAHFFLLEAGLKYGQVNELRDQEVLNGLLELSKAPSVEIVLQVCEGVLGFKQIGSLEDRLAEAKVSLYRIMEAGSEKRDPALVLHAALSLIFATVEKALLNTSGKFVPVLLEHLEPKLDKAVAAQLRTIQQAVVLHIRSKSSAEDLDHIYPTLLSITKDLDAKQK